MTIAPRLRTAVLVATLTAFVVTACDDSAKSPAVAGLSVEQWEEAIRTNDALAQKLMSRRAEGIPIWIKLAESHDAAVRRQAAYALVNLWADWRKGDHAGTLEPALRILAEDSDPATRSDAARSLIRLAEAKSPSDPLLVGVVRSEQAEVAAPVLNEIAITESVPGWVLQALDVKSAPTPVRAYRCAALLAHGSGGKECVAVARESLHSADRAVRAPVMAALTRAAASAAALQDELAAIAADATRDSTERRLALRALTRLGEALKVDLPEAAPIKDDELRREVELAYAVRSPSAPLPGDSGPPGPEAPAVARVHRALLDLLRGSGTDDAIAALRTQLRAGDPGIRAQVVEGLWTIGPRGRLLEADLREFMDREPDYALVQDARRALAQPDERTKRR